MPTIVQTVNGKVTGLWGSALRRTASGKLVSLKMGDLVNKGDVILTTQDGIVQLTPDLDAPRTAAAPTTDLDRVIAELNEPDARTAPAAGLNPGDGSGLLPALRVGRISEDISPTSFTQTNDTPATRLVEARPTAPEDGQAAPDAPGPGNERPTATASTASGNEDNTLPISLAGQDNDGSVTAITVTSIPAGSTLLLADGVTPVVAGQTLTPAQAAGLLFRPAPDFNGGAAVTFTVTDNQGAVSAPATAQITVLSVNDTPLANPGIASVGPEFSSLPVNLTGTDIDGTVTSVSVTTLPPGGSLYLADGVTPVVPGTPLTPSQASQLVFVPTPGSTGPSTIVFTVTDNEGATSTPNTAQVNVTPVPTTVTLSASATTVAEGGSVVYSATVDHPVSGSPLVITLSNGNTITIPVGQSSGNSAPVVPRADDAYAQGSATQTIAVAGTAGGNFSSLVTGSTIATTVTDDADATTVSLSTSAASVTEGGSVVYTATVNNPVTGSPLVVTLSNGQTITIPVGQSSGSSAPVVLRPDDANLQGTQTVSTAITGTSGGNFEAVNIGPAVGTTVTDDADASTVTLSASATTVTEGGSVVYTASLSSPVTGAPLVITLSNGQTITIPVGQSSGSSAPFAVRPDDAAVQGTDTLTVNIAGTTGGNFEALTPTGTATTTVTDDADASTVTLSASAASVTEGGSITYTASVSSPVAGAPLVITLSNGQTLTIPVGQSSASSAPFAVRADDVQLQGSDTLNVTISATTGGNFEALTPTGTATTTVSDDADATTATLTASAASVTEGGSIVYTVTLNNAVAGSPLVVTLDNGQTITIPVGQSSGSSAPFAVRPDDALVQGTDTLTVNISTTTGGNFEAVTPTGTATTTVSDNADATTLTVSPSAANVSEGGSIVYTATLSNAVSGSPLVITLSNGQTISIAVGQSSGSSAPFAVRADDANVQPDDTFAVNVSATSGGNFEALTPTGTAVTTVSDDADVSTVTLSSSAASVSEGGSVVYTATLSNPVVGTPLVITLNNGQNIVIPVGQSSADSAPFAVRADDNFVQGAQSFSVSIAGTTGGSYESLATTSTVNTTVNDDTDTSTVSLSASPAVAEGGSIVYTATLTSAAQTAVTVTLSNGSIINIAAGDSSGTVSVAAPSDDVYVDAGSVSATIASATGGNFESLAVDPSAASTSITDTLDTTTISLTGSASVSEAGTANYTLSLTSVAQTAVTVTLTYSGTAANGVDFSGTTTVTIPAGASLVGFSVAAIDDVLAEGPESFTVAIGSATGGNFESLVVSGGAGSVTTGIVDNDISTVSLSATPSLSEAGGNIVYTATLTQAPATALTVTLSNGAVINVAAGALTGSVSVPVAASDDVYVDPTSLSATIASTSGGGIPLAVDPAAAVTAITDTIDTTTLSLSATPSVAEGGSIVYTASLTSPAGTAVNVTLSNGATLSIAAGALTGSVSVAAPSDDVYVDTAPVSATITAASGGNFESLVVNPAPALTTVTDTVDTTTVSLTATATVAEGGSIVYTASLNAPAQTAVTVNLSNGAFITIAAGDSTGTVAVLAPADDVIVDAGTVSATITGASGGNFESLAVNPAAATTAVTDTLDSTTVSLTATPSVSEGGSIVYTASLTSPADTAVSVTLSNGATITILAGTSSGSVAVAAPGDDVLIDASSVSATITAASGGNFENLVVNPAAATTSVTDTIDTTTVSLTASPSVAEGGNIVYTASLGSPAGTVVTVTLSNGAQITIAAGASTGSVLVAAPTDDVLIDAGSVSASIVSASGGNFENLAVNPAVATTSVSDTIDTTTVSLTASPAVAEGGSIVYTASLTSPAGTDVTVTLSNGATLTILAGDSTGSVSVAAPSDDTIIDAGTVSATIASASGGNFENLAVDPSAATTSVSDTIDTTTLSLTASPSVAEGGNIVYTASLTAPAGTAMSVTLSNGATLTILAGASTGSVSVAAPSDDAVIDAGSVSATITAATGGNFENLAVNPSAATTAVSDTVDTTTVTLTATPAVAEGGSIVYTASLTAPADTAVTVRLSNGAQINIAAGASTGTVSVAAPADDTITDAGTVSATITSATGGNFENLAVDPSAATTSVSDTVDTTTVTLSASASVAEGGSIVYTASLTSAAAAPVTVTLSNGAQITILAGDSVGTVSVPAPSEDVYLDAGNVSATITTASGGNFENLAVNPAAASTAISDTLGTTTVSLSGAGSVAEGASASYTVSLTSPAQTAVTITLSYSGTAADGSDFTGVTSVTIPANSSSASFSIATLDDVLAEGAESFSVAIASATGGNFENLVVSGSNGAVTTGIVDNDISTISLSATPAITEAGGGIVYTATLTQAPVSDLSVTLSNGAVITVTAGSLSGSVTVPVAADEDVHLDPSSVSASIASTSGGGIALSIDPTPATTAVTDTIDTTTVSLAATPSVAEGGSIVYTATLTSAAQTAVVVNLSNGQQINIAAGANSGTLTLAAPADDTLVDNTTLSVNITSASGGNFESLLVNPAPAVTTVTDTVDTTTLTLTATPTVAEGGSIVYTASLSSAAGSAMTVTLSNGLQINIAAGASTGTLLVAAPTDDALIDAGSVSATITGTTGGNFESLVVNPSAATTLVTDTIDTTTVTLTATASVSEGGNIVYTASLNNAAGTAVTVTLSNGAQINIAAGASTGSVSVPAPVDDTLIDAGTVSATITGATGGNFENLAVNPAAATTSVSDTIDSTTVSLTATPSVAEGGSIVYTASLTTTAGTAVTVTLSNGTQIVIAAGDSTGSITLPAPTDDVLVDAGSVSLSIASASGGNFESLLVNAAPAVTSVTDTIDTTTVSLTATPSVAEGGSIVYTASLTSPAGTAVTVTLSNGAQINIAAGASSSTVSVPAPSEDALIDAGPVSATIASASGGNFENLVVSPAAAVTSVTDTVDTTTVSLSATPTVAEGGSIVYTATLTAAAGTAVTVNLSNGAQITIAAGASTGTVTVPAPLDDVIVDAGSVSATIASASGGNFENLVVSPAVATTSVTDTIDTATVSLTASASVAEGGSIAYTASLTHVADTDVTVNLSNGAQIVIAAGTSSNTVSFPAPTDDALIDAGTVSATITSATGGNFENLVASPAPANTSITDTVDTTTVSLSATPSVAEGGSIVYTASLTSAAGSPVTVTLSNGVQIVIAAGSSSNTVTVAAPTDDVYVDAGSVSATITTATGGNFESLLVNPAAATTSVTDTIGTTTLSLTGASSVAEGASASYTVSLNNPAQTAVTVTLNYSGTAADGSDFSGVATVTIPANASAASFSLATLDDALAEGAESFTVAIASATGGNFENLVVNGAASSVTTDIVDNDISTLSLSATPAITEAGGNIVYTATLTQAPVSALTVTLANGAVITVAAGALTGTVTVPVAASDDVYLDPSSISTTIASVSGGGIAVAIDPAAASTAVNDTVDTTTVSLSATPTVAEGGSIVYTASLTSAAQTAVVVTLSNGAQINIAAGASSGTVTVAAPGEDVYADAGSVSATITSASGGNFENLVRDPAAAVTSVTDTVDTTTVSLSATASVAEGGSIVYTASLGAAAQTPVTVRLSNGAEITILAGDSTGTVSVPAPTDDVLVDAGSVSASITTATGGGFESLAINPALATTTVTDTLDTTTVSLTATATVAEGGNIVYTASLTSPAGTAVTVTLSNGAQITILAGASSGTVSVPAPTDDVHLDAGPVSATITTATGGNFENLAVNPAAANTSVTDTIDTSTLSLSATPSVAEGGSIVYTASLTAPADTAVTVQLSNGAQITILAGDSTGTVSVLAPTEDVYVDAGSVSASISSASGGNFENLVVNAAPAVTSVTDTIGTTTLSITGSGSVAEGASASYTVSLTSPAQTAVTITLSYSGTAANGSDFTGVTTVTIPANSSSASFSIATLDDALAEGAENFTVAIASATGGNFENLVVNGAAGSVSTGIIDNDISNVSLSATNSITEAGGNIVYTATLTQAPVSALTVTLSNGAVINIAAGALTGNVSVPVAASDDVYVDPTSLSATIASTSGGGIALAIDPTPAVTSVVDTIDTSTVTLSTATASVTEGGSIVYSASVNNPVTGSPFVVTLSNGQTITIPVGQSSGSSAPFAVRGDDAYVQGTQTLNVTITGTTGGNYEAVATTGTATTTVNDDADATTVTLGVSAASVGEGGSISYTASVNNPVTGSPLVITLTNGQTITIPVGSSSGSSAAFAVRADDAYVQGTQTLTVGVSSTSGGNYEALTTTSTASTTVSDDADATTVSVSASAASVTEGGSIVYTASVNNAVTGSPLVVTLSNGQTITIPVGQSSGSSAAFAVRGDDAHVQGTQTLNVTITGTTGGNYEAVTATGTATTTVTDDADATTVSITASATTVNEGGSITYTATLSNAVTGAPLVITLTNGQTITIPVGQSSGSSAAFAVRADDAYVQGTQTLSVGVSGTTGGNFEALTTTSTASTTVTDDSDATTVSVSASAASVTEGGSIVYTATVSNAVTGSPLVVTLSNGQTITIPVGQSSGSSAAFAVRADDAYLQGTQTLNVTITGTSGGNYEAVTATGTATTTVSDDADPTTVTLTASAITVNEGGSITYTATLSNAVTGAPLVITLTNGQTITIPVGQSSGSSAAFAVRADDAYAQGTQTLSVGVSGTTGGNYEALTTTGTATTTVTDDGDLSTVSLTASATSVTEGGSIVYTASVTNPVTGSALVVTLSNGQTITIPVGQSSGSSAAFAVRGDDAYVQGTQTLNVTITGTTGGNYEALTPTGTASTTVTDDADATTVTLSSSAATLNEGGSITYTATLNNPVTGSALVITLTNGQTITIPVGSSSGTSAAFAVRADDANAQGSQVLTVGVSGTTGGNFEALTTTSTTSTTVTDDGDVSTVSLSASAATVTEGGSIIYTATVTNPVSGSPLVVTLSNGQTITIPVGQSSGSSAAFAVRGDDAYVQGTQTLNVTITGTSGGNFEAVTATGTATTTVTDDADATSVSITASAASVAEGGSITYTATLSNAVTGAPLVITLTNGQTITIPVGSSSGSSAAFAVRADDAYVQGTQTLSVGVSSTSGGNYEALTTTSTASTTVTDDSDATTVSVSASAASVTEGGSIVYTATVSNAVTGSPLVVTLSNGQTITIPVGQSSGSSAAFAVRADDTYVQGTQTLNVTVTGTTGGNYETVTPTGTATTTVNDDADATTVTLTASAATVNEGGSITYTATLSNAVTGAPLVITLTNGQTITIPVGSSSGSSAAFAVRADDAYVQGTQTLAVGVSSTSGGTFEALTTTATASTTVTDDADATTVSVSASAASVTEGGSIVYTATVNNAVTGSPLVVTLSNGQTITIPVGQSSGSSAAFAVRADDAYVQGTQTLNVTITGTTGGNYEAVTPTGTATTTVTDDADATTVSITASAATVTEGGSLTYTATLSNAVTGSPLVINLTNGQQITIPVGQSSGTTTAFAVRADDAYVQGTQTLTVGVSNTSGGNFEGLTTTSTAASTVTDDADATTVTVSTATASVVEGGSIVYTATTSNPVTGSALVVTLSNGQTITIPVGQSSGSSAAFAVRADDAYVQGTQTLNVTITGTTGGNYEAVTRTGTATTTVTDDADASTVTLTASAASVAEGGSITYTAALSNAVTGSPLVITLTNGQTITIPVGQSSGSSAAFAVRTDDAYVQGTQTLTVGVSGTTGGNFEALTTTSTASTTVSDDSDATTVNLTASAASVAEGGSITYTATVANPVTGTPLVVTLSNGQTITIPVGQSSATSPAFAVRADDAYAQGTQTLNVTITGTSGGNYEAVTPTGTATTTVTNDADATTVTLTASAASVTEGGSIVYTATVSNAVTGTPLTLTLNNGQTITIPVGQTSASSPAFAVRADDAYVQATQTLTVGIGSTSGGSFEALSTTSTATTTVTDDADATTVTLTASAGTVSEGGSITYTASVNNPVTGSPFVVTLSNGQTITIPVGQSSASSAAFAVRADDAYVQGTQTLTVGITGTTGGNYEARTTTSTATTTVTDDADASVVTLSVSSASVTEGGSLVYTASVNNAVTGTPLVINLSNGQTLTIPVGQSSVSGPAFAVRADDAYAQGTQTVSVGISSTSGGSYEALTTSSTASATVTDDADPTVVTLTASAASVTEGGSVIYTAALSNAVTGSPLTLTLSNGQTITIPVGQSSGTSAAYTPRADDAYAQGTQPVAVGISNTSGGNFEALTTTSTASVSVSDDSDVTTVSLSGTASLTEGGSASYTLTLSNPALTAVTVTLSYSGAAANGSDYTGVATVTIPAGASSASFNIATLNDTLTEPTETLVVSISGVSGGGFESVAAHPTNNNVNTSILDNDARPVIDLDANNSTAAGTGYVTTFVENGAAVSIADTDIAITDVDSTTLTSATISLSNLQAGDVLAVGALPAGITPTVLGGIVYLTGTASLADYQTAIRAVTFANTSDNPSTVDRIISVSVIDGSNSSLIAQTVVHVTAVNDAPVATGSLVSGTEDTAVVFNWAQFGVTDVDTAAASLGIRVGTLPADGTLQTFNGSTWVNVSAGSLVSKATIDAGSFRFVPDANESGVDAYGGAAVGNRQADYARFTFTPNDGATDGTAATVRIDITPVADAPTLTHNASSQVTGVLSNLTSVGLTRDYFDNIATLTSGASSTNPNTGEVGIETAVPTSSALISNIGVAGNVGDTGVQIAEDDAYRVQGLIYLEAGRTYTFAGYADDTVRLEIGGNTVLSGQWGGPGQAATGTFTSTPLTPTVTGYYSLEFMVYNTSGPGSYDLNLSVDGATAVDVSTANFQLYQSITQVDSAGGQRSDFVPNAGTGEGGYYPVAYNTSVQSLVYLAPVLASLTDTDGSESLAVQMQSIPVGAVLSDGTNTFTATAGNTSVNITGWDRAQLSVTLPSGFTGTTNMTAVATSTEASTGATATTSVNVPVTVAAGNLGIPLSEIDTFNADALIGQAGADVYSVSQVGTGLAVNVTQGVAGSIPAQTGVETTGTANQAFNTGAGNDYVQSGAGDDTIYLGDSGSATHPSGGTATQAQVAATRIMTLADDTNLTSATTGLLTNEADDTNSSNNSAGNTSVTTWSDVANAGSGNDAVYGQAGTDLLYGGTGNDYLNGGAGIDGLRGGAGNDTLVGGAGNDVLRGDAGADVFRWELADRGTVGAGAASDIVTDFNNATPAAGGDVLDLRDLLQGEASVSGNAGNLANYLHFTVSGGNTTIQISSSGAFSGGNAAAYTSATDQSITLQGVDLTASGTFNTDQQIIQDLLSKSKLIVDGS